jgi:hypothetical protein
VLVHVPVAVVVRLVAALVREGMHVGIVVIAVVGQRVAIGVRVDGPGVRGFFGVRVALGLIRVVSVGRGVGVDGLATGGFRENFPASARNLSLKITRADVAGFLVRQLDDLRYAGRAVSISN